MDSYRYQVGKIMIEVARFEDRPITEESRGKRVCDT